MCNVERFSNEMEIFEDIKMKFMKGFAKNVNVGPFSHNRRSFGTKKKVVN